MPKPKEYCKAYKVHSKKMKKENAWAGRSMSRAARKHRAIAMVKRGDITYEAAKLKVEAEYLQIVVEAKDKILGAMERGMRFKDIVDLPGVPNMAMIYAWRNADPRFREQYDNIRQAQQEIYSDEIIEIADDDSKDTYENKDGIEIPNKVAVARAALKVNTREWLMQRVSSAQYAPKQQVDNHITFEPVSFSGTLDNLNVSPNPIIEAEIADPKYDTTKDHVKSLSDQIRPSK